MGIPSRSLKLLIDFLARVTWGFCPVIAVMSLTAFSRFEVTGADAEAVLDRLTANRMTAKDGGTRLTHMLTELGGIESEVTITRLAADRFYINSGIMMQFHDRDWLRHHIEPDEDVLQAFAV